MHSPLRFVYFGRLSVEKGFDILMDSLLRLSQQALPFRMDCFGQGELESTVVEFARHHEWLHYHGRQPFSVIAPYLSEAHFCLIPSRFLETFGLTALESLSYGVPVIAFARGALQSFVLPALSIDSFPGDDEATQLTNCLESLLVGFDMSVWKEWSQQSRAIASDYDVDQWYRSFLSYISPTAKRILLVSDYSTPLGGEETYLYKLRDVLESYGFVVSILGHCVGYGFWSRVYRYFLFALSVFQLPFFLRLHCRIAHFQPDLVRYHSVLRSIGWLGLVHLRCRSYQTWMMFHDFGYVHPYPHRVYREDSLLCSLSWSDFVFYARPFSWYAYPFLLGKLLLLRLLRFGFSFGVDRFFVPSAFMKTSIEKTYRVTVSVLPHFFS